MAMTETPNLIPVIFFGELSRLARKQADPGEPVQALRYTTRGDGGGRGSPIKKTGLGRHLSEIQRECLSGVSPSSAIKKGETLRALSASLSSVGLSRVMALWALQVCATVAL
jgi:hypothetical protein